jgi:hypothetical protein
MEKKMTNQIKTTPVEELFGEFNETLRTTGQANFDVLERCPEAHRKELRALMNVAALAYRALEPERQHLSEGALEELAS